MSVSNKTSPVKKIKRRFYGTPLSPNKKYTQTIVQYLSEACGVLDVGCGHTAPVLASLPETCGVRAGIDLAERFDVPLEARLLLVTGNSDHLPFDDGSFGTVISRSVLEHLHMPMETFREVFRVLRPGGHFVFLTPNRWDYVSVGASLIPNSIHPRLVRWMTGREERDTFPTVFRANTSCSLRAFAKKTGFEVTSLELVREHPHYLQFNTFAYLLGVLYEQVVQRPMKCLRPWILGVFRRPEQEESGNSS